MFRCSDAQSLDTEVDETQNYDLPLEDHGVFEAICAAQIVDIFMTDINACIVTISPGPV